MYVICEITEVGGKESLIPLGLASYLCQANYLPRSTQAKGKCVAIPTDIDGTCSVNPEHRVELPVHIDETDVCSFTKRALYHNPTLIQDLNEGLVTLRELYLLHGIGTKVLLYMDGACRGANRRDTKGSLTPVI